MSSALLYPEVAAPDPAVLALFNGLPTGCVSDARGRSGCAVGLVPLSGVGDATHVVGPAHTVRSEPGDNVVVHRATDMVRPGDVLVVDAGGALDRAIAGGLLLRYAASRGAAAVVIDGVIRDLPELRDIDVPVYARGVCPHGPWKDGSGEIRGRITVGGAVIHQGDLIVADRDGVVVVPVADADHIAAEARAIAAREESFTRDIDNGLWVRPWVDKLHLVPATDAERIDA